MTKTIPLRTLVLTAAVMASMTSTAATAAEGDPPARTVVSRIADGRILESSGLAVSVKHRNLVYTMNDSKNRAAVYAVQVSTGRVVGQVDLEQFDLEDPESIAVDPQGRLWLGDLGDNDGERDDASILVFDEPGSGTKTPAGLQRFPVSFPDGPQNIEGMLVHPSTRQVFLINKTDGGTATLFSLPQALRNGQANEATDVGRSMPAGVADAAFTPDGRHALVKTATGVVGYDASTWTPVTSFETPGLDKGESLTVEPGGRSILLGSEGNDSPIMRVTLPATLAPVASTAAPDSSADGSQSDQGALPPIPPVAPDVEPAKSANATTVTLIAIAGVGVLISVAVALNVVRRRRRLAQRHRRLAEHGHG